MHSEIESSLGDGRLRLPLPAAAPPAVTALDVRVRRGARGRGRGGLEVIHGVSFTVARGSVTGVIGPSGGGKTSLLRAIVGVQLGVEGDLRVLGYAAGDACLRRRVGYATQAASVYGDLTVRENLRYFATLVAPVRHGAGAWTSERLDALLAHVGLTDQAPILVDQLSGGQRSRVSLAAAMISGTDLLVLDEPTVGADPLLRRRLWRDFRRMAAAGTTILVSSHVMDEANRCDRLLLLYEGRLLAQGTPAELLATTDCGDLEEGFLRLVEHPARRSGPGRRADSGRQSEPPPAPASAPSPARAVLAAEPADRFAGRRQRRRSRGHPPGAAACPPARPVDPSRARGTTARVLRQLGRDRRTLTLVLLLPPVLLLTLRLLFHRSPSTFDRAGPALLGIFPLMTMFFVTSVAMLRERTSGTLERLLTTPVGRGDLLVGYGLAFAVLATAQAALATALTVGPLGLTVRGSAALLFVAAILSSFLGTSLGLWMSAFARTEFEAVQLIPAALLPQFMLCGILVPRHAMLPALDRLSTAMPMTYVVDAMARLTTTRDVDPGLARDIAIVTGCTLAALGLAAVTLRRRHP
ncbi:ABC transporter ATP-binding protein/permease [Frankia sp. AgB32]|uniref:ABC transporter ATP-binding protein/permease n=1 Tax=Frankia sp. AgB32 TaxID=631119 RepID=UPI00200DE8EE|nr:ABC transporter ATP-binding protein/permease [Frankia sp. AgB32]MCK9897166.1 ABC transporter ATP-binding protein/permease [Frankia sp. AgB32]